MKPSNSTAQIDYSLMAQTRPPILGLGSETPCGVTGWSWCGYCGYTGHCLGPVQTSCPERDGWHRWLEQNVDLERPAGVDSVAPKSGAGATANRPAPGHREVDSQ